MRRLYSIAFLLCFAGSFATSSSTAVAQQLKLDAEKSKIEFVGTKPDGKHDGGFKKFTSTAKMDPSELSSGSLTIKIDAASLWSDTPKLTNHLKNPDFFNVRKFPDIKFKSTEFVSGDQAGEGFVKGKMTMLGKTNEVKIPIKCDADAGACTLSGDFEIDRTKWGMDYGQGKVDNKVAIKATLVFKQ